MYTPTQTIYKTDEKYIINLDKMFQVVKKQLDRHFLVDIHEKIEENRKYTLERKSTCFANVFDICFITFPVENLILIDEKHNDIGTESQLIVELRISLREEVIGE